MKINQLEMFLATCATGSITEAARKLAKSRTTVSSAIGALEDELGVELLQRSGNHVALTAIGEAIRNDCERMVMIATDVEQRCQQHLQGARTTVRIARDDTLPESLWRQWIQAMKQQFPSTSVSVYMAPPPELESMVASKVVDIAYCLLPASNAYQAQLSKTYTHKLGELRMMAVAHRDHPLSQLSTVTPADLARYTEFALATMSEQGLQAVAPLSNNYIALPFFEHLRDAALDGAGWSNIPSVLVNPYLRDGSVKVLNFAQAMQWQSYGVIQPHGAPLSGLTQWLAEQLEHYLANQDLRKSSG